MPFPKSGIPPLARFGVFPSCARDDDRLLRQEEERYQRLSELRRQAMMNLTLVCVKCGHNLTFDGIDMYGLASFRCPTCDRRVNLDTKDTRSVEEIQPGTRV